MLNKKLYTATLGLAGFILAACTATPVVPTATPTSQPTATATIEPSATPSPTATASPTATVKPSSTPRPTATATPVPQPGDLLFSDTFDDNSHNWEAKYANAATFHVQDGSLTGEVTAAHVLYWAIQRGQYKDVDLTFDATRVEGLNSETMYGGICRYQDNNNFYLFEIGNASYSIQHLDNGTWRPIVDWKNSGAIHPGKATNSLRIICVGDMLQMWANGTKLVTVHYPGLKDGIFGLTDGTFATKEVKVNFDNVTVKIPETITLASGGGNGTGGSANGTPGSPKPTQAPATQVAPNGQGSIQIVNNIDFGVHFVLWGPQDIAFDAPPHQTVTIPLPQGAYGWNVFANNCELYPTDNLKVQPANQIRVEAYTDNSCGYQVYWQIPP